jgi:hypothetical protein
MESTTTPSVSLPQMLYGVQSLYHASSSPSCSIEWYSPSATTQLHDEWQIQHAQRFPPNSPVKDYRFSNCRMQLRSGREGLARSSQLGSNQSKVE